MAVQTATPCAERDFIIELNPEVEEAVDLLTRKIEAGAGRRVEAEVTELLERNPGNHMAQFAMGVYCAKVLEDFKRALHHFEAAVAIHPSFAEAHINLGMAATQRGDVPKAVTAFRAVMQVSEDEEYLGIARERLRAIERIVLKNSPFKTLDDYIANARLFNAAFEAFLARNYELAITGFKRVLSEVPDHVQSYGNMAMACAGLGRKAEAMACFEQALKLDPSYTLARANREVVATMTEGVPFVPAEIAAVEFYADRLLPGQRR